jgi:hypothetical protein
MTKQYRWFEILLVVIVMAISLYAALSDSQNLSWRWFTRDDAYYYFKVAQNISEGHGSTFDGINPTNGYHPLWMLVCIPIFAMARFNLILPLRVLLVVMSGLSATTAILFFRLIGKVFVPAVGAIAAVYWAFSYDVLTRIYQQGLETGIAVFFVVLLVYKLFEFETTWRKDGVTNRQLLVLGLIAMLATLSRLDLIFLTSVVGVWIILRKSPLRYFLPLDVAAILVSVLLAFVVRLHLPDYYRFADAAVTMVAISLVVKIPLSYLLGLYQPDVLSKPSKLAMQLALFLMTGTAITTVIMLIVARLAHFEGFPRITLAYDLGFTALFFVISRFGAWGLKTRSSAITEQTTSLQYLRENWKSWVAESFAYYGMVAGGLVLYMLSNKYLFGTFSPISGQIKRWWGSLAGHVYGGSVDNALSFFGISHGGDSNAWHPLSNLFGSWATSTTSYLAILFIFCLLCYLLMYSNKQKAKSAITQMSLVPLFASAWMQVLYYHALGYSAYKEWYWVSQIVLVVLAISLIFGMLYQAVHKIRHAQTATWGIALVIGFMLLVPLWRNIRSNMTYNEWKPTDPNNDIAAFLEAHTEPGSIIAMTGGGNAGYFIHDRTVINLDGLINSYEYFQLLKEKKAGGLLANEGLDYILANSGLLNQLPYKGQFAPYIKWMDVRYGGKDLVHYQAP